MQEIEDAPGIVMYTLVNNELRAQLEARCAQLGLPAIPILDPALTSMGRYLGIEMSSRVGAQRTLDAEYYSRIEALNYACLLYTSPSPRDLSTSRMPSSA